MSWNFYRPYVSVAQRRANGAKQAKKIGKQGRVLSAVTITGRAIASSFWGKAWCAHLESFSDFSNRLPRGRTYVRNGSVIDLQVAPGEISALVMGSSLYRETITIAPLAPAQWRAIKAECAGQIDSLVGLLQGRLSDAVMRMITHRDRGLFPQPNEIKMTCSCPDSASLCKHLAAVLYGLGARLDTQPELLFRLRGVDHLELIAAAVQAPPFVQGDPSAGMDAASLADVFGIEIEPTAAPASVRKKAEAAAKPALKIPPKATRLKKSVAGPKRILARPAVVQPIAKKIPVKVALVHSSPVKVKSPSAAKTRGPGRVR